LMDVENITFDDLHNVLDRIKGIDVHVVGDTIVDRHTDCTPLGATAKTPTMSLKKLGSSDFVGGAGIVAKHLASLGGNVTFSTMLGQDETGRFAQDDLEAAGIKLNVLSDELRPTTLKERFWASDYKLLQVDTLDNNPISTDQQRFFRQCLSQTASKLTIFSDFRHGIFHSASIGELTSAIPNTSVKVADTQVSNRWGNVLDFKEFDLLTPNEQEARFALADQDTGVRSLAQRLQTESATKNVILKLREKGVIVHRHPDDRPQCFFHLDSFAHQIVDAVGAGDALLALSSLVLASGGNIVEASILGSLAAAESCAVKGNVPIKIENIHSKLNMLQQHTHTR
ncbi:PfkB family carbohydrate kinase, partial [Curvivirga aplysinae]|uniref:PfkB family carbohydrate kinase n=1 Tax=Curvivirga aplysinae TaxID=2529852 RepID=UPI0012BD1C08